jgi:hypothetical protein
MATKLKIEKRGDEILIDQLLAHGRWFSPASSTTKAGRHDIAEILLKVALKHQKSKHFVVRRKLSHLNLLLRNHWANCNQTLVE